MMHETFFLFRFALYLIRGVMWLVYGVARFIAKPGSRIIAPVLLFLLLSFTKLGLITAYMIWWYLGLSQDVMYLLLAGDNRYIFYAAFTLAVAVAYYLASRILALLVGTFPTVNRPLAPMRRLTSGKRKITSAPVRIAVPPLRMP